MSRTLGALALVASISFLGTGTAAADINSRGVIGAFTGQLVISQGDLPEGKNDRDTISKIKAAQLKELQGEPNADVQQWHFHYTAFLRRAGASSLQIKFFTNDKDQKYVANQRLDGADPKSPVLTGDISINEDEGLTKGKSYLVKLVTDSDSVVASAQLVMK
ncbi:MAG TPA: hypothetical protein VGM88_27440 [Kofleriaceae bacterium]|jgi:hypothetical protein